MRVAIVHDDLVQWGGAERVLLAISEIYPEAPIYTSVFDEKNPILAEKFRGRKIVTSFMQKIPFWRDFYKALLPFYPIAFEQFDFTPFDLVISQTTRFAKSVITKPGCKHITYCHTPPRFLWGFSNEKTPRILEPYFSFLRVYDRVSSKRVDLFLAGSKNAAERIKKVYKVDSKVLEPFVDDIFFEETETFSGGYFLTVSRLNEYKRVDLAVKVFNQTGERLVIIGKGPAKRKLEEEARENIEFLAGLDDKMLLGWMSGCRGLVITAEEDFGLTSLEAQALGKGVIAFGRGGSLETVVLNRTGVFFNELSVESLAEAVERFKSLKLEASDCQKNAVRFTKEKFKVKFKEAIKDFL